MTKSLSEQLNKSDYFAVSGGGAVLAGSCMFALTVVTVRCLVGPWWWWHWQECRLRGSPLRADFFHSKRLMADKQDVLRKWMDGDLHVICATTSFGLGIHHPTISLSFIIHATLPYGVSEYLQQVGRGGRLEDHGMCECVLLFNEEEDVAALTSIVQPKVAKVNGAYDAATQKVFNDALERIQAILRICKLSVRWSCALFVLVCEHRLNPGVHVGILWDAGFSLSSGGPASLHGSARRGGRGSQTLPNIWELRQLSTQSCCCCGWC
jgi:hypothetical protein